MSEENLQLRDDQNESKSTFSKFDVSHVENI